MLNEVDCDELRIIECHAGVAACIADDMRKQLPQCRLAQPSIVISFVARQDALPVAYPT